MKKQIFSVIICSLIVCFAVVFYVSGWTEPTSVPPAGNVFAPLNVGSAPQIKNGALQVNGFRNLGDTTLDGHLGIGMAPLILVWM